MEPEKGRAKGVKVREKRLLRIAKRGESMNKTTREKNIARKLRIKRKEDTRDKRQEKRTR